jgi:hypothetical protein
MTVHRDRFLVNKTNRRTEFQFLCVVTCFGQKDCPKHVITHNKNWKSVHLLVLFTRWRLMFMGRPYVACFMSPFWHPEF